MGNAKAHGVVTFTNKSNMDLVIPSHIVIATSSGPDAINFVTTAQSLVPQNGSFPGTTIEAQETGDTGNVPEGSITVIPQSSLDAISQYNKTTITASNLTVTNQNKTDGGGATTVLAVTQDNLNALTQTLHQKIQSQVKSWLASVVHQGDFQGKLLPDVLGSTNPLPDEKLSGAPAVNQPAPSGTFTGSIVLTVNTLIAKAADVQAVAGNLVNSAAAKAKPAMTLPTHASLTFASVKTTPSNDGQSLAIAATATGNVIPLLSSQDISGKLAGKGASDAVVDLKNGTLLNGIKAKDAHIEISPSFLPSLPMLADHIQVILQASKS